MLDAHGIAEGDEKGLLPFHEENLQEVLADHVAALELERFVHPGDLLDDRFSLEKDGAEFSVGGEAGESGLVDFTLFVAEVGENLSDDSGVELFVDLVGVHRFGAESKSDTLGHARRILA